MTSQSLFVDLDHSLLKTDYLHECIITLVTRSLIYLPKLFWVCISSGRVALKQYAHEQANLDITTLPINSQVVDFISKWRLVNSGKVYLISASVAPAVKNMAAHLGLFDGCYGTEKDNLRGATKLRLIQELSNGSGFSYVGDSYADLPVWQASDQAILVNPRPALLKQVSAKSYVAPITLRCGLNAPRDFIKLIRVHQWAKNSLILLPSLLAIDTLGSIGLQLVLGFFAFSMVASAFYVVNDLHDLNNDRRHATKSSRPLASGAVSLGYGVLSSLVLLSFAALVSFALSAEFQLMLVIYAVSTFAYSKYIKKVPIADLFFLAGLYLLRIVSGAILVDVQLSNWLLTFSVFVFLFLASVKRWVEINKSNGKKILGRGYTTSDVGFISAVSYFSGMISVLVVCLYLDSDQALVLLGDGRILWLAPLIILYWILELLLKVGRSLVDEDPVKYALKSKSTYVVLLLLLMLLFRNA